VYMRVMPEDAVVKGAGVQLALELRGTATVTMETRSQIDDCRSAGGMHR